jgi:pimeloyl-ACP methyl ester carboxylesterase
MVGQLVAIGMRPSNIPEVGQGVQEMLNPKVYGRFADEGCSKDVAYIVLHPAVNFWNHYLVEPLNQRRRAILALNSRSVNADNTLLMEQVIQDVGAGVRFLREKGYKKVVLIANSAGGPVMSLYQSQAEKLTIKSTPAGDPFDLIKDDVPPADAIALVGAHLGRAFKFRVTLDPAILNEADQLGVDPDLDMFNPDNGPPYKPEWFARYRAAQKARHERITEWALGRLDELRNGPQKGRARDQAFVVYRTYANPATMDSSIDPNDRPQGTIFGSALAVNYSAAMYGRFTTLTSYLSQWSPLSVADGAARIAETSVPVINVRFSADEGTFPTETAKYTEAAGRRCEDFVLKGARHFPFKQKNGAELVATLADKLVEWTDRVL